MSDQFDSHNYLSISILLPEIYRNNRVSVMYKRPISNLKLNPDEKRKLLEEYFQFYREEFQKNPEIINSKLPRNAFDDLLNDIGELILKHAEKAQSSNHVVIEFLKSNPLPKHIADLLPEGYRTYCLALNALKQWLSAEQSATDRYMLGGTARKQIRDMGKKCLVTGESANNCKLELHHPVRDGRPPILISKKAHSEIEKSYNIGDNSDEVMKIIYPIKRKGNRSWVMLKLGCELLLGIAETDKSKNVQSSSKTFARKASEQTNLEYGELLTWIEKNDLC